MDQFPKVIGKAALCLLMSAVGLRPVMVELSASHPPRAVELSPGLTTLQYSGQSKPASLHSQVKNQDEHQVTNFKILPKNNVSAHIFPRHIDCLYSAMPPGRSSTVDSAYRGHSPRNYLILRI